MATNLNKNGWTKSIENDNVIGYDLVKNRKILATASGSKQYKVNRLVYVRSNTKKTNFGHYKSEPKYVREQPFWEARYLSFVPKGQSSKIIGVSKTKAGIKKILLKFISKNK